ncbi:DDE-type integrase/transposase/recombinase [Methylomonas sp. ZR1]|uniref:Mu transposase C-terminal domain-containing protein n=1 Tax=Methylomonas sp. ZR1 TaxID=1797072 RepID=UPI00149120B1
MAVNSARTSDGGLIPGVYAGLPTGHRQPVKTDEKQRIRDGARQYILNFVSKYPGKLEKAVAFINEGFAAGTLDIDLHNAVLHCNDKANAERVGKLAARTLQRWAKLRDDAGSCTPMKTRVKTDWRDVVWLNWYFGFYRKPQKPGISEAYRLFAADFEERGLSESIPSEFAVRRLLKTVPKLVLEWGRSTGAEYKAMQAFTRRDWSGDSNEIWVGDGHSFKAKVRHPDAPDRLAFTPEVTVIIDAASRFIVGWAFSLSENQIAVSEALGNAMVKHGKPLIYYSDNGSGQTAKTIDCPAGGMLARLGVQHETGIPGNPQGRGIIEGMWDVTTIWAAKQFPTFQGTGMDAETLRKNTVAINSAKNKNGEMPDNVPFWEEFIAACEARFEWYNTQHKHSALGGKTPAEVYYANFDDSWHCHLTDDEKATLYRPFKERTPARGEIRHLNNIYFHAALAALPANTKVRMYYDLYNADQVWVTDLDGVAICVAEWNGNRVAAFPITPRQNLKIQRAKAKKKLGQERFDVADIELNGLLDADYGLLEAIPANQVPGLEITAKKIEEKVSTRMAVTIPEDPRERHLFWREWTQKSANGTAIPDELQMFMSSYPTTAKYKSWEAYYNAGRDSATG